MLGSPSHRKYPAGQAIVNAGLWLNSQRLCADFAVFHAISIHSPTIEFW